MNPTLGFVLMRQVGIQKKTYIQADLFPISFPIDEFWYFVKVDTVGSNVFQGEFIENLFSY